MPHFTTLMNYLEKEELTSVLQEMIKLSALPMKGIETEYAIDSTGFVAQQCDGSGYCHPGCFAESDPIEPFRDCGHGCGYEICFKIAVS